MQVKRHAIYEIPLIISSFKILINIVRSKIATQRFKAQSSAQLLIQLAQLVSQLAQAVRMAEPSQQVYHLNNIPGTENSCQAFKW